MALRGPECISGGRVLADSISLGSRRGKGVGVIG
jgi:hypothetical protein